MDTRANLFPGRGGAVEFSIGGNGYIGLGADFSSFYSEFLKYDTLLNAWTRIASFPPGNRGCAVAFVIASKGYIGTGIMDDKVLGIIDKIDLWEYDIQYL